MGVYYPEQDPRWSGPSARPAPTPHWGEAIEPASNQTRDRLDTYLMGAAFGSGASQTVFGAAGAGNFLTRLTTGAAIVFMITSLALSYFSTPRTVTELLEEEAVSEAVLEPQVEEPEEIFVETVPIEPPASEAPGSFEEIPASEPEGAPPADPLQ